MGAVFPTGLKQIRGGGEQGKGRGGFFFLVFDPGVTTISGGALSMQMAVLSLIFLFVRLCCRHILYSRTLSGLILSSVVCKSHTGVKLKGILLCF